MFILLGNPLKGTTKQPVNETGIVQFADLKFENIGENYKLCFQLTVTPAENKYADISTESALFDIVERKFYLHVHTQPGMLRNFYFDFMLL